MVETRTETGVIPELRPEPNRIGQYTANTLAAVASAIGVSALIAIAPSNGHAAPFDAVHASAPMDLALALDSNAFETTPQNIVRTGVLTETVTALDAMEVLGADREQADDALAALREKGYINKKSLSSGMSISVHLKSGEASETGRELSALTLRAERGRSLIAKRLHDGTYFSAELNPRMHLSHRRIAGTVGTNLAEEITETGVTRAQVAQFLSVFTYASAKPKKLSTGDRFEMVFEVWEDERGAQIESGDVVYASLQSGATRRGFYRYTPNDNGETDFFDTSGDSAKRFLLRKPVHGAPVSSGFGRRIHPIGGYSRLHKGVDFRAPEGARIYSAGDGIVEKMGHNGGYGRQVVIKHADGYKTAYAHMSGYNRELYVGRTVKQGDLVGFVGSSGHSTGPHLHYEVMLKGRHIDPMSLQLPTGRKLAANPAVLSDFDKHRREIDRIRRNLGADMEMADLGGSGSLMRAMQAEAP